MRHLCRRQDPAAVTYELLGGALPPLHEAARRGDATAVAALLKSGAEAAGISDKGYTPLHWAATGGHVAVMKALLTAGADVAAEGSWYGFCGFGPPLHWATRGGSADAVKTLLAVGADVDVRASDGCTALHNAGTSGSADAVKALLAAGADVDVRTNDGRTALHKAGRRGSAVAVKALLAAGAAVDVRANDGRTALHEAGSRGSADTVKALLAAGADIDVPAYDGRTALHNAGQVGSVGVVMALLAAGAEMNAADDDGWTPLHHAVSRGHTSTTSVILRGGADPAPVCCTGETPLCIAVKLGHRHIMALLPPDHPPNAVSTPALEAVKSRRIALLDDSRVRPFLHTPDRTSGDGVLHVAARRAHLPSVVALLRRHVDVRHTNIEDETPLACALSWYLKKLSAARDLAGIMVGRPDIQLRVVAEGLRPPRPRPDGLRPGAVSDALRRRVYEWRAMVVVLFHGGALTTGLGRGGVRLCTRVVASFPSLGPRQAVRLLCTRGLRPKPADAVVVEELE